jgi:hypothetical protein
MRRGPRYWLLAALLGSVPPIGSGTWAQPAAAPATSEQDPLATRELVQEIQFMLQRLKFDPGPLDGIPRQLTNAAIRRFQEANGLPLVEVSPGGRVPAEFLARLRAEAGRAMFGATAKPDTAPPAPPSAGQAPVPTAAPAAPKAPPMNRFAACAYDPEDFHIGANRYTPDTFLQEGFDGSTARAVANLKDRLEEGRQIAEKIGISALKDVQRQARVLQYFECRLKIEQGSAG